MSGPKVTIIITFPISELAKYRRLLAILRARERALKQAWEQARAEYGAAISEYPVGEGGFAAEEEVDIVAWRSRVEAWLADAEAQLVEQVTAAATATILSEELPNVADAVRDALGPSLGKPMTAAEALSASSGEPHTTDQDLRATLSRVLGRLASDVPADERREVLDAAARFVRALGSDEERAFLADVRIQVQRANEHAEIRRKDSELAAALLNDLEEFGTDADDVREALRAVEAGQRVFDPELRLAAEDLADKATERAGRLRAKDELLDALSDLGYEVSEGFETVTARNGAVRLSRPDWPEHAVAVRLDGDTGRIRTAVLRTVDAGDSDDARRVDVERETQWCAAFAAAREKLADAGFGTEMAVATAPGQVRVPLAAPAASHDSHQTQLRGRSA